MKRLALITLAILLLFTLVFFLKMRDVVAALFRCSTNNISSECVVEQTFHAIDKEPEKGAELLTQFAKLKKYSLVRGDFRSFSTNLHFLGKKFFDEEVLFSEIINAKMCPKLIKDGCVHGYVMAFIDSFSLEEGHSLCLSVLQNRRFFYGCWHAYGHSFAQKSSADETLTDILHKSACPLEEGISQDACWGGIFHEDARNGLHKNHDNYYKRGVSSDFDTTCQDVPDKFRDVCLFSRASFSQYNPGSNSKVGTDICSNFLEKEDRLDCEYFIKERDLIGRGTSFVFED